jgi:multiple sugar transport system permease protein
MTTSTGSRAPSVDQTHEPADHRSPSWAQRLRRWRTRGGPTAIVFALPAILVFAYFSWGPIVRGLLLSFQKTNFLVTSWVGWSNFTYVLSDPLLPVAIRNTLVFVGLGLLIGFPVPLFLAVFMAELRRGRHWFTVLSYLPVVIPPVVSILLWKTFYDPSSNGLFNTILGWFGLGPVGWLNSATWVLPSMVLEATWAGAGATVIIYVAAMTGVRTELYEAAELDGAGIARKVWHVTLPQLRGVILVMLLLQLIGTMQVFAEPFLFTGGGPGNASTTILLMIYNYAFVSQDFGAASALSMLLAVAFALLSAVYFRATRGWSAD